LKRHVREMEWYDAYLKRGGADRSANTTPGNKKGGLANIVEKVAGLDCEVGFERNRRRPVAGREGAPERPAVRRHAGERLHLRHAATRLGHSPPAAAPPTALRRRP
jgi:hypothetical protein